MPGDDDQETSERARRSHRGALAAGVIALVIAALAALYFTGTLDRRLAGAGLNFNECARDAQGQTLCGSELQQARARERQIAREEHELAIKREAERRRYREERARELRQLERVTPPRGEKQAEAERAERAARRKLREEAEAEG